MFMVSQLLAYAAAAVAFGWGVAHLVPTRAAISGFGELAVGNRRILAMEWVAEGLTLIFIGVLAALAGSVGAGTNQLAVAIKAAAAGMLVAMAVLTASTGARTEVVFFRICPLVKAAAALLLVASIIT
ncbi:MAG: hypothetical protein J2P45_12715 [Candidatus Dormibacteraeota bacterium]|nr:hypothetical protein [Candidatus Dormibacteraeota bacterium]